ncbi:MAG TPA: UDP-glucose 4-epimerase GalE [Alphaproteobacteria bacterium]|nr:UDP-glucose 4-epimerase GalE [Alphaproteobacteria bacterium]
MPNEALPVLVTGGAGYIGSHVCKALADAGFRPVTYDNLSHGHRWAVRWGPFEQGDLAHISKLEDVVRRYQPIAVIHLAGSIAAGESVVRPARYYSNNVMNMLGLLGVMRRAGMSRLVFSSSAAVYGEPQWTPMSEEHPQAPVNAYGASKMMCERILQDFATAYGIRSVSLRYFNAAGADADAGIGEAHRDETHLVPLVLEVAAGRRSHAVVFGTDYDTKDGTCIRDYVHVSDLAAAHLAALKFLGQAAGAHAFNLGSGTGASVWEVIETARAVTGCAIPVKTQPRRPGDPAILLADPSKAKHELGWRPAYPHLEQQIASAWAWHNQDIARAVKNVRRA